MPISLVGCFLAIVLVSVGRARRSRGLMVTGYVILALVILFWAVFLFYNRIV